MSHAESHSTVENEPGTVSEEKRTAAPSDTAKVESAERAGNVESIEDVLADLSIYRSASDATKTKALTSELPGNPVLKSQPRASDLWVWLLDSNSSTLSKDSLHEIARFYFYYRALQTITDLLQYDWLCC